MSLLESRPNFELARKRLSLPDSRGNRGDASEGVTLGVAVDARTRQVS